MSEHDSTRDDALRWVWGSTAPEKSVLNIGFMALSDSASVIVAATQGFAEKYGLSIRLHRQSSWAGLRDRLLSGELDAELLERCRELKIDGVRGDLSQLAGLLIARCLASEALKARAWLIELWRLLRPALLGREAVPPRIWST